MKCSRLILYFRFAVAVLLAASVMACEKRELCYDHSHVSPVSVEFDWSQALDAKPATMVVWFFSEDGHSNLRYELTDAELLSGTRSHSLIKVRPGRYRVLCHNGSTENNIEEGSTFESYCLHAYEDVVLSPMNRVEDAPVPDGTEYQAIHAQASELYSDALTEVVSVAPSAEKPLVVRFSPRKVTSEWNISITGVENLRADTEVSAIVTGVAEAWSPALGGPSGSDVTVPFPMEHCGRDCLKGHLVIYGDKSPHDVRHMLRLYTSGRYYYDFDISDQVHASSSKNEIYISLNGLHLPSSGEGMSPGIDEWADAEDINLRM